MGGAAEAEAEGVDPAQRCFRYARMKRSCSSIVGYQVGLQAQERSGSW